MGLLEEGQQWLTSQRNAWLSVPVEYLRRDGERLRIHAVLGKTLFKTENSYGTTIHVYSRDFLIAAEVMPKDPQSGDKVFYDGVEYEVLAPGDEPVWRWSGTTHEVRRIHTKEIGKYEREQRRCAGYPRPLA